MDGDFIAYYRVSTERQGRSGLGLDAQREAVARYLNGGNWRLVGEFTETESGGNNGRPELARAMALAKRTKATIVVAKLDRLSRDTRFMLELADAKVRARFVDLPDLRLDGTAADRFVLTLMSAVAEFERRRISERTRAALAAKRARGEPLGHPSTLTPGNERTAAQARAIAERLRGTLTALHAQDMTQREIAAELNAMRVPAPQSGTWSQPKVQRVMARLGLGRKARS